MKKAILTALAIATLALTGCGGESTEKKVDDANAKINEANELSKQIAIEYTDARYEVSSLDAREKKFKAVRAKMERYISLMSDAKAIDDANTEIVWADRDKADDYISSMQALISSADKELARIKAVREKAAQEKASAASVDSKSSVEESSSQKAMPKKVKPKKVA